MKTFFEEIGERIVLSRIAHYFRLDSVPSYGREICEKALKDFNKANTSALSKGKPSILVGGRLFVEASTLASVSGIVSDPDPTAYPVSTYVSGTED